MPRYRSELPQSRRHIWVYDEDWQWLKHVYSSQDVGPLIREIVHSFVLDVKRRDASFNDPVRD